MNKPTYEDIVKYVSQHEKALVEVDCWPSPVEVKFITALSDFEMLKIQVDQFSTYWIKRDQITGLELLPTRQLQDRITELSSQKKEVLTVKKLQDIYKELLYGATEKEETPYTISQIGKHWYIQCKGVIIGQTYASWEAAYAALQKLTKNEQTKKP